VRTEDNERLGLGRAVLRLVCQYWGYLALSAWGILTYFLFGKRQLSLSDPEVEPKWLAVVMIVIMSLTAAVYLLGFLWAAFRRHKRAWHDLMSRTRVVYDLPGAGPATSSRAAASAWGSGNQGTGYGPGPGSGPGSGPGFGPGFGPDPGPSPGPGSGPGSDAGAGGAGNQRGG
jgi:hypothetical protein